MDGMSEGSQSGKGQMSQTLVKNKHRLTFFGANITASNRNLSWLKESEQSNKYKVSFSKDQFDKAAAFCNESDKSNLSFLNTGSLEERYKRNAKECEQAIYMASVNGKNFNIEGNDNKNNISSGNNQKIPHKASRNSEHFKQQINDIEKWMNGKDLVILTKDPANS